MNNHYNIKYLTININQILPKLPKRFHPLSFPTYLETKKISTKTIFKYQNQILQSKHVLALLIAKKLLHEALNLVLGASFRHKRKEKKRGQGCEKEGTRLIEVAKICSCTN